MTKTRLVKVLFILGFLVVGLCAFWLGTHFAKRTEGRGPAAIPKTYDFSHLEGEALREASISQILRGPKVVAAGELRGVELGHFTMRNTGGISVSMCDVYPQVVLRFVAGDMAVSGESPTMIVKGTCQQANNPAFIDPVMFDYPSIMKSKVKEQSQRQPQADNTQVTFENVSDTWPRIWVLDAVEFSSGQDDALSLQISHDQILTSLRRNVLIEW